MTSTGFPSPGSHNSRLQLPIVTYGNHIDSHVHVHRAAAHPPTVLPSGWMQAKGSVYQGLQAVPYTLGAQYSPAVLHGQGAEDLELEGCLCRVPDVCRQEAWGHAGVSKHGQKAEHRRAWVHIIRARVEEYGVTVCSSSSSMGESLGSV